MESRRPVDGALAGGSPDPPRRLESWKAIAAYFDRDVRTVRRWEQNERLPVHRHRHLSRGSIYAFQHELDEWLARRSTPSGKLTAAATTRSRTRPFLRSLMAASVVLVAGFTAWSGFPSGWARSGYSAAAREAISDLELHNRFEIARHQLRRRAGYREEARAHLEATVARDPGFAEAHAWLAEAYVRQALFDRSRRADPWVAAEAAARRALALDATDVTAHAVLGRIFLIRDWDGRAAKAEAERAIELDPANPEARSAHALYLRFAGRMKEAVVERERAQRSDPLNPQALVFLGDELAFARRYEEAIQAYHRALELERDYRPAVLSLADVYARTDRPDEAAAWQVRALQLRGEADRAAAFEDIWRRGGAPAAIRWLDGRHLEDFRRATDDHLWDLAYINARLGNADEACLLLERAYAKRDPGLLQARVDPDLDSLRADPRFVDLLRRVGPR